MFKINIKSFISGIIFTLIGTTFVVFASNGIKSAEVNENKVFFNEEELDISSLPMISIVKENEVDAYNSTFALQKPRKTLTF